MTHKTEAAIVFLGGPHDGLTSTIDSHETLTTTKDDATYVRTDQQLGDHRVYHFTLGDGEAPPTETRIGPDGENLLDRDLKALGSE